MKRQLIFFCMLLTVSAVMAQNVGIGTTTPADLLHLKDGMLRLEGNNKFFNFHTATPNSTGLRFYTNGTFKGGWFYRGSDQLLNLTSNGNLNGFIFDLNTNRAYLGRNFQIGSEVFGVRASTSGYGGMYMETSGESGQPFYGYATDSLARMWHYYDGGSGSWHLYNVGNRLTVTNAGNFGIGTTTPAERLHLLGNLRLDGGTPLLQFYQQGTSKALLWHNSNTFYVNNIANGPMRFQTNNSTKMSITELGNVGISTLLPAARLHVYGDQWDLSSTDGVMMLGSTTNRLAFGIAIAGAGAGTARIYSKGTNNRLILGGDVNDVLSVLGTEKRVGIGTNDPLYTLDIHSLETRGIDVTNDYTGASTKYGARFEASSDGTGGKYGLYSSAWGSSSQSSYVYGGRFLANGGSSSTANVYGIYAQVSAPGSGNHYGIYTTAGTANPGANTKSWALYANGNSYFSNEVRIGTFDGATGYKLSVDGKIMSEELKVQMSANWPDYVFEEAYEMMTLEEIDGYIKENKHLPGVPSAKEVEEADGFHVGEMNRILLEKVEELTLLLIAQDKKITELEKMVVSGKNEKR